MSALLAPPDFHAFHFDANTHSQRKRSLGPDRDDVSEQFGRHHRNLNDRKRLFLGVTRLCQTVEEAVGLSRAAEPSRLLHDFDEAVDREKLPNLFFQTNKAHNLKSRSVASGVKHFRGSGLTLSQPTEDTILSGVQDRNG